MPNKKSASPSVASKQARIPLFVEAMIQNGEHQREAAIAAGYAETGAERAAGRLMKDPEVVRLLEQRRAEVLKQAQEQTGVSIARTLQELARVAYFDPRKLFKPDGSRIPVHELDADTAAALASFETQEITAGVGADAVVIGNLVKVKVFDKNSAIDKAMRHLGLFKEDNEQKPKTTIGIGILTAKPDDEHVLKVSARAWGRTA